MNYLINILKKILIINNLLIFYEYNEEIIQMNKKTDIINSKSKKISNDIKGLLKEPSFKLLRNLIEKKFLKTKTLTIVII